MTHPPCDCEGFTDSVANSVKRRYTQEKVVQKLYQECTLCKNSTLPHERIARQLMKQHPDWTRPQYAQELQMSLGWVKKWSKRLREADPQDEQVLTCSLHRAPSSSRTRGMSESSIGCLNTATRLPTDWGARLAPKHSSPICSVLRICRIWDCGCPARPVRFIDSSKLLVASLRQPTEIGNPGPCADRRSLLANGRAKMLPVSRSMRWASASTWWRC